MKPQSQPPERYQNRFLLILLPLIASDRVSPVLEGWRLIRRLLIRLAQERMYEILDYDSVLELQDPWGGETWWTYIERTVTGGFTKPNEWRQVMVEHRTRKWPLDVPLSLCYTAH